MMGGIFMGLLTGSAILALIVAAVAAWELWSYPPLENDRNPRDPFYLEAKRRAELKKRRK